MGQHQQLRDQSLESVDFFELAGKPAGLLLVGLRLPERHFDLPAQRGERRAQLVREGGTELPHLADRALEPRQRFVERVGDFVQFVAGPAHRQPQTKVRDVDFPRGGGKSCERRQREARHPSPREHGGEQPNRHAPQERLQEDIQRAVD